MLDRTSRAKSSLDGLTKSMTLLIMETNNELIGYIAPDGSTVSVHDYEFLSTAQQQQCRPFTKGDLSLTYSDWERMSKHKRPEDNKDNKAWAGAWLEGEMTGYAKCMIERVLNREVPSDESQQELWQTSNPNKPNYLMSSNLNTEGMQKEWIELWQQIEIWYGDIQRRETAKQMIERLQRTMTIQRKKQ